MGCHVSRDTLSHNFESMFSGLVLLLSLCTICQMARAQDACLPVDFVGECTADQTCLRSFDYLSPNVTGSGSSTNKGFQCGTTGTCRS